MPARTTLRSPTEQGHGRTDGLTHIELLLHGVGPAARAGAGERVHILLDLVRGERGREPRPVERVGADQRRWDCVGVGDGDAAEEGDTAGWRRLARRLRGGGEASSGSTDRKSVV